VAALTIQPQSAYIGAAGSSGRQSGATISRKATPTGAVSIRFQYRSGPAGISNSASCNETTLPGFTRHLQKAPEEEASPGP
jgi:hypothetical protein